MIPDFISDAHPNDTSATADIGIGFQPQNPVAGIEGVTAVAPKD
ncbi:hypothetical protein AKL17_1037 [Frigidibacter mobilis]|uniref:Uncharacterized protein n=1 Tax=Frigidibacter mobilis TaxID=1335048 RepID=A0A159Z087_9RHOB|nr:hypothetical protein AKL17_1037 [Frigidibacter mobilis]